MTYEERIAAAQAKMQAFKEKMAASAEKAKAAHAMKKEEIAAAIDAINADLDELDTAIAEEFAEYETDLGNEMDELEADISEEVTGSINAAKENIRLAKERRNSKIYALKLKSQMKADALKEKIADKRAEKDKAAMESYILDLLDYAECCQQVAFAAAIEADMTLLEAAEAAADYVEKYGEPDAAEQEAPAAE